MKWSERYRINSHDTDINGIVRTSLILRYMQETANLQMYNMGPTSNDLRKSDRAFILSKINMSIYKPLYAFDQIVVESWSCESKGASFTRCSRIYKDDMIVAELISIWGLIGITDKKLYRVSDIVLGFEHDKLLELDTPTRIKIPKDLSLCLIGERNINYSDIDLNNHMNNTIYPDMLCDFLPYMKGKRVISLMINFITEAIIEETIKVYCSESDGVYYFRTVKEDGAIGIEAEMIIEDV